MYQKYIKPALHTFIGGGLAGIGVHMAGASNRQMFIAFLVSGLTSLASLYSDKPQPTI